MSLPPRTPNIPSHALAHPEDTRLGGQFDERSHEHSGTSGFHIIAAGVDGFVTRMQMIRAAERTLDLQYYIFRGDETGRMIADELAKAAERGVRVRILVDDADTVPGDEQILTLAAHPNVEVRVFNPFDYRGHNPLLRNLDFVLHKSRLDYRMHNKLFVVDNAVALIGGRNIGNQYFQIDPGSQFADDDVFSAGPIVRALSATFDDYWNSRLAVPAAALRPPRHGLSGRVPVLHGSGIDYLARIAAGQPFAGLVSPGGALVWAQARVVCDSPDKKDVVDGARRGRLMARPVSEAIRAVRTELLMVTPYFVPSDEEIGLLKDLRRRGSKVRILSNSLESAPSIAAYAGYSGYRVPLLQDGVELYEVRSLLGNVRGSGQTARLSRFGNYSLHAKLYVFDRERLFVGSMNFDQRSLRLNTEVGLIIDSPQLAGETARRFEAMADPQAAYRLALRPGPGGRAELVWETRFGAEKVQFTRDPARSAVTRAEARFLSLLPLQGEL